MKIWCIYIMVLCQSVVWGQNYIDILSITYNKTTNNTFENATSSTKIEGIHLDFTLPIPLNSQTFLLTGLNFDKSTLALNPDTPPNSVYTHGLEIGLHRKVSDDKGITFLVRPQICTDQGAINLHDTHWGVLALYSNQKKEHLKYSYGIYYKEEYYGPLFVPLFGIYYLNPGKRWEFNVMAPIKMTCFHHFSTKSSLGIQFEGMGTSYKLTDPVTGLHESYLERISNELFVLYQFKIFNTVLLNFDLGYSFFRSYKIFDKNDNVSFSLASIYFDDDRTVQNTAFKDGFIFRTGLRYRFDTHSD